MLTRGSYETRRRESKVRPDIIAELPYWAVRLFVALFIFCVLYGASHGGQGLAWEIFNYAKNAVEQDITFEEIKTWVVNIPADLGRFVTMDVSKFWSRAVTGDPMEPAWPVSGEVIKFFGWIPDPQGPGMILHPGIDILASPKEPVLCCLDGKVESIYESPYYGLVIEVEHGNGYSSMYGRIGIATFEVGSNIKKGGSIGIMGMSGDEEIWHLHFEFKKDGVEIDPMTVLPARTKGP